jgi:hypothetical protein
MVEVSAGKRPMTVAQTIEASSEKGPSTFGEEKTNMIDRRCGVEDV